MTPEQQQAAPSERHEPSAWLRTTVATRTREVDEQRRAGRPVIAYLGSHETQICDRCRKVAPVGTEQFYGQVLAPEPWLRLIACLCESCHETEVGKW